MDVKLNTIPIEAYRRTESASKKDKGIDNGKRTGIEENAPAKTITLPGNQRTDVAAVRVNRNVSMMEGVLTGSEKETLLEYFGRLGDKPESSQIYNTRARTMHKVSLGSKVDLKG